MRQNSRCWSIAPAISAPMLMKGSSFWIVTDHAEVQGELQSVQEGRTRSSYRSKSSYPRLIDLSLILPIGSRKIFMRLRK